MKHQLYDHFLRRKGRGYQNKFNTGRLCPKVRTLTLYIPLLAEKIPLLCTFDCQMVLLLYTSHGEIVTLPTNLLSNTRLVRKLLKQEVFCHFNAAFK